MKLPGYLLYVSLSVISGCTTLKNMVQEPILYQKTFFNGAVAYQMGYEAKLDMDKAEALQKDLHRSELIEGELPDYIAAAIFNAADVNGNRTISPAEAKRYLDDVTRATLDSLPKPNWKYK